MSDMAKSEGVGLMAAELSITVPQDLAEWGERKLDNAIAKGHSAAGAHMHNYEQVATITGVLLRERKSRCAHGEWLPWLAEHFAGSQRTAYNYLEMAEKLQPPATLDPAENTAAAQPEPAALPAGPDPDRITHAEAAGMRRAASTAAPAPEVVDAEVVEPQPDLDRELYECATRWFDQGRDIFLLVDQGARYTVTQRSIGVANLDLIITHAQTLKEHLHAAMA